MMKGLVNPSRIKVYNIKDSKNETYSLLLSNENTNGTMPWFRHNSERLEANLLGLGLKWVYAIETCSTGKPFIYMFINPDITMKTAQKYATEAIESLPMKRELFFFEGAFKNIGVEVYDYAESIPFDLLSKCSDVFRVEEI